MSSWFAHVSKGRPLPRLSGEKGATSIEYAILVSLVAAVIALVVFNLGNQVRLLFESATKGW